MTTPPDSFPPLMPDPDRDPGRVQAATLLDQVAQGTPSMRETFASGDLSDGARRAAKDAIDAIGTVRQTVHRQVAQLDSLSSSDLLPRDARKRLLREAREVGNKAVREAAAKADLATSLLETALTTAAQPAFPDGADRIEAREEFRLLLAASTDPAATVIELAAASDQRLAALASGTFGASYLRSRGVPEEMIAATRIAAAQSASKSGDPRRSTAAAALGKLDELRKLRSTATAAASFALPEQ